MLSLQPLTICGFRLKNRAGEEYVVFDKICIKKHNLIEPVEINPGNYHFSAKFSFQELPFVSNRVKSEITIQNLTEAGSVQKSEFFDVTPMSWTDFRPFARLAKNQVYVVQFSSVLDRPFTEDLAVLTFPIRVLDPAKKEDQGKVF